MTVTAQHNEIGIAALSLRKQGSRNVAVFDRDVAERSMDSVMRKVKDGVLSKKRFLLGRLLDDADHGDVLRAMEIGHRLGHGPSRFTAPVPGHDDVIEGSSLGFLLRHEEQMMP